MVAEVSLRTCCVVWGLAVHVLVSFSSILKSLVIFSPISLSGILTSPFAPPSSAINER